MVRFTFLGAWAVCVLGACGDNQDPQGSVDLWTELQTLDYRSFERAPGYEVRRESESPHSDFVDIYINDVVSQALTEGSALTEWPVGSLIVKDGFTDDGELELVAVMEKREDGWYWAEYFDFDPPEATYSGQPAVCTGCHSSGSDFVRAFDLP